MRAFVRIRLRWRRTSLRLKLAATAAAGSAMAAVSGIWLPPELAVAVGAAALTLLKPSMTDAEEELRAHLTAARSSGSRLLLADTDGKPPKIRQVIDATSLGVHPAEAAPALIDANLPMLPQYVNRDADVDIRTSISSHTMTLVIGDSTAGKTRAAYEAVRSEMPTHRLVVPTSRSELPQIFSEIPPGNPYVVWLDDLERFLGPDGITLSLIEKLKRTHGSTLSIVATIRTQEYDRYNAYGEAAAGAGERELWRHGRDTLRAAHKIRLDRRWSSAERERAAASRRDPRIARALSVADRFGIAESLAAGPELAEAWKNAWAPGAHPRGAALVQAAVNARRCGIHKPLPRGVLVEIHEEYLEAQGGPDLRPETIELAFEWAQQPASLTAASRMLLEYEQGHYKAFDYLIDVLDRDPVSDHTWSALLHSATPQEALDMGLVAMTDSLHHRSRQAFEVAARSRISAASVGLAAVLGKQGHVQQSVEILRSLLSDRRLSLGASHPETLETQAQLAYFERKAGHHQTALDLLAPLHHMRLSTLGSDHPDTLDTELWIALNIGYMGDRVEARNRCVRLLGRFEKALGANHIDALDVRARIAWLTGHCGDYEDALRLSSELLDHRVRVLGSTHADVLYTRSHIVKCNLALGRYQSALELARGLARDRSDALGPDHPHTLHSRRQVARLAALNGHAQEAIQLYREVVQEHVHYLGVNHQLTLKVVNRLNNLERNSLD
jgi:hypothetical protein